MQETAHCTGNVDPTVVSSASCKINMSVFSASPWSMTQGTQILFRVVAGNQIGYQTVYSGASSGAVIVSTAPVGTPAALILDAAGTGKTALSVTMT